jgi:CHAD domain-containing protein
MSASAGRSFTVARIVRRAVRQSYERLVAHEADLRIADDPESVHQARVATRRLRSDLRTFQRFLSERWTADLSADLRWLGSELGAVRDIEVQRDRLRAHAAQLPASEADAAQRVVRRLDADREAARFDLLATLTQARYGYVRDKLAMAAEAPAFNDAACEKASVALMPVVRGRWTRVRRAVDQLGDNPSDDALHRVRVRAKQCRYAAEACEPAFGKPARSLARSMAKLQDVLGEHQDATVAIDWLTKTAHECSPAEAFAIGMLAQVERNAAAGARAAFPAVWRAVDTKRGRGWL